MAIIFKHKRGIISFGQSMFIHLSRNLEVSISTMVTMGDNYWFPKAKQNDEEDTKVLEEEQLDKRQVRLALRMAKILLQDFPPTFNREKQKWSLKPGQKSNPILSKIVNSSLKLLPWTLVILEINKPFHRNYNTLLSNERVHLLSHVGRQ